MVSVNSSSVCALEEENIAIQTEEKKDPLFGVQFQSLLTGWIMALVPSGEQLIDIDCWDTGHQ